MSYWMNIVLYILFIHDPHPNCGLENILRTYYIPNFSHEVTSKWVAELWLLRKLIAEWRQCLKIQVTKIWKLQMYHIFKIRWKTLFLFKNQKLSFTYVVYRTMYTMTNLFWESMSYKNLQYFTNLLYSKVHVVQQTCLTPMSIWTSEQPLGT